MTTYTPAPVPPSKYLSEEGDAVTDDDQKMGERNVDLDTVEMSADEVRELLRRGLQDRKAARKAAS